MAACCWARGWQRVVVVRVVVVRVVVRVVVMAVAAMEAMGTEEAETVEMAAVIQDHRMGWPAGYLKFW